MVKPEIGGKSCTTISISTASVTGLKCRTTASELSFARRGGLIITAAAPAALGSLGVLDARMQAVGAGAGDDRHAALRLIDHRFENGLAFRFRQARYFAGDAERCQSVDAVGDEKIHHAPHAGHVERSIVMKRSGKNRKNTL